MTAKNGKSLSEIVAGYDLEVWPAVWTKVKDEWMARVPKIFGKGFYLNAEIAKRDGTKKLERCRVEFHGETPEGGGYSVCRIVTEKPRYGTWHGKSYLKNRERCLYGGRVPA